MRSIREMDGRIDASLRLSLTARITRSNNYAGTIDTGFLDLEWIDILLILLAGVTIRSRDTHGEMYKGNIARVLNEGDNFEKKEKREMEREIPMQCEIFSRQINEDNPLK